MLRPVSAVRLLAFWFAHHLVPTNNKKKSTLADATYCSRHNAVFLPRWRLTVVGAGFSSDAPEMTPPLSLTGHHLPGRIRFSGNSDITGFRATFVGG